MAETPEQYFSRVLAEAGLDDAVRTATLAALTNPKVATPLTELIRRGTDDFNSMKGRVDAFQSKEAEYKTWYDNANGEYVKAIQARDAALAALNGTVVPVQNGNGVTNYTSTVTKEDLVRMLAEQQNRTAAVVKTGLRLASRHAVQFKEELDVDALEKIALEKNLPLDIAYEQYVKPRVEAQAAEKVKLDTEAAVKKAVDDYASKHHLPADEVPTMQSFLHNKPQADLLPKDVDADLLSTWANAAKH